MAEPTRRFGLLRLRTVLLYINLVILAMPIVGMATSRVFENELLRRTEAALEGQAATLVAMVASEMPDVPRAAAIPPGTTRLRPFPLNVHKMDVLPPLPAPKDLLEPSAASAMRARFGAVFQETEARSGTRIFAVDHRGFALVASDPEMRGAMGHAQELAIALGGEGARALRQCAPDTEEICLVVAEPIDHQGKVLGAILLTRAAPPLMFTLDENWRVVMVFLMVLAVAVVLQTGFSSWQIVAPLHDIIEQAERISAGERGAMTPLEKPGTVEFDRLSRALSQMADTLDARAQYIQNFASNVSHEFKTPLTSIRGSVELLQDHFDTMAPEERGRFLAMIDRHAERLQRLVGRLLDLARADVAEPTDQTSDARAALMEVSGRFLDEGLDVSTNAPDRPVQVKMAPEVLDSILGNLLDNARQHGGPEVVVKMTLRVEDVRAIITVEDDGVGIPTRCRDQIFEPFFTTARDAGGTGLGLSVMAALIEAHGGAIALIGKGGALFEITLPRIALRPQGDPAQEDGGTDR